MRSLATNLPLGATVVAAFAGIYALIGWRSHADRRDAFLKALAASDAPNSVLVAYRDAADPMEMAARYLTQNPDEKSGPIRAALAAAL